MRKLKHQEALEIVLSAARSYAQIVASRDPNAPTDLAMADNILEAIEILKTPPIFQPTFSGRSTL